MTLTLPWLAPVARVLLAFIFVYSGFGKLMDPAGTAAYIEYGGLPGVLVWPTIVVELAGGLLVALGLFARISALALAAFSLVAGILYHYLPGQGMEGMEAMNQSIHFMKNLGLAGGLLFVAAMGPGPYSLSKGGL
ncbi:DoxX family protein [Albimonas pacifica]|uniref:Putative oxidoreductase n=1 Tax=Albimonas pacifica TaxID=1114924 RepID=A0A1I3GQ74_9RHOB|nr:DoxX family protein [Albimonas pacifica]SFI25655.1 putative oxidoreductase [Albimonas pacifica]